MFYIKKLPSHTLNNISHRRRYWRDIFWNWWTSVSQTEGQRAPFNWILVICFHGLWNSERQELSWITGNWWFNTTTSYLRNRLNSFVCHLMHSVSLNFLISFLLPLFFVNSSFDSLLVSILIDCYVTYWLYA